MIINSFSSLNKQQLAEINQLSARCKRHDGNIIAFYPHLLDKPRAMLCNVLCYDNQKLVGFLRPFFFYEKACEIALMVAPSHRRKGIARKMLQAILPSLTTVDSLIFSVMAEHPTQWLADLGLTYTGSQYEMRYDLKASRHKIYPPNANIRLATLKDLNKICEIHQLCFPEPNSNLSNYFGSLMVEDNYRVFLIENNEKIVGKTHLRVQNDIVFLADLAVLPSAQGQGFGTKLIQYSIQKLTLEKYTALVLDVETQNQQALNLYSRLGFKISNKHDYWKTPDGVPGFGLSQLLQN